MPREPEVFGHPTRRFSSSTSRVTAAMRRTSSQGTPGHGSRSMRSSSGCSIAVVRTACGFRSMLPRLVIQASCAGSVTTSSWAVRPDGKRSSTVGTQSGRLAGARFWKKPSPVMPST